MKANSINSKLNILITEADSKLLKKLEAWVVTTGHETYVSDDGNIALELFDAISPDIVLVSQELKSLSGIEFIEKVKIKNPSQAVILIMENEVDSLVFKRSIDFQVDKYLNKPVEPSLLFRVIEELAIEKLWHKEFEDQKKMLQNYKDAIDISFSVSKHDKDGKIFDVNDSFCKTTGLTYDQAIAGLINPLNNSNIDMKVVWDRLKEHKVYRDRQTFIFEDKRDNIIDVIAVPILNDNEENEYLVFSNDVSEIVYSARKIKQQEIDTKLQKLEHIKEVNKIKDSFLTVFTHELKTPLNAIINFSEYVKKHLLKENFKKRDKLVEQVKEIHASGWHMLDMITNLIEAIKLRDSKIELNISSFSLNNLIQRALLKYGDDLKDIRVIESYKTECIIACDEERMLQILNNLISNAVKYSRGVIAITLKSNHKEFVLEVLDNGDGFLNKKNVFLLFEQSSEDDMTRTAKGTGVGLYIVKSLCDKMGFKIELLKSKKLGGARVVIRGKKDTKQ